MEIPSRKNLPKENYSRLTWLNKKKCNPLQPSFPSTAVHINAQSLSGIPNSTKCYATPSASLSSLFTLLQNMQASGFEAMRGTDKLSHVQGRCI